MCAAGLAPHHDPVELFVCQTAGSKTWRLYHPVNGDANNQHAQAMVQLLATLLTFLPVMSHAWMHKSPTSGLLPIAVGHALPARPSGDLPPDSLGDPIMEVTLQACSVLVRIKSIGPTTFCCCGDVVTVGKGAASLHLRQRQSSGVNLHIMPGAHHLQNVPM